MLQPLRQFVRQRQHQASAILHLRARQSRRRHGTTVAKQVVVVRCCRSGDNDVQRTTGTAAAKRTKMTCIVASHRPTLVRAHLLAYVRSPCTPRVHHGRADAAARTRVCVVRRGPGLRATSLRRETRARTHISARAVSAIRLAQHGRLRVVNESVLQ